MHVVYSVACCAVHVVYSVACSMLYAACSVLYAACSVLPSRQVIERERRGEYLGKTVQVFQRVACCVASCMLRVACCMLCGTLHVVCSMFLVTCCMLRALRAACCMLPFGVLQVVRCMLRAAMRAVDGRMRPRGFAALHAVAVARLLCSGRAAHHRRDSAVDQVDGEAAGGLARPGGASASAPGLGSPLPHPHRDWARSTRRCTVGRTIRACWAHTHD